MFLAPPSQYPQWIRKILPRKIAAYGFALLAASFLFGSVILDFFGIGLFVVEISEGLVLAVTGWNLLNEANDHFIDNPKLGYSGGRTRARIFPLTLPITVGPGCISIAITLGAHLRYQSDPSWEHVFREHLLAVSLFSPHCQFDSRAPIRVG